jgi:hypothetical protein
MQVKQAEEIAPMSDEKQENRSMIVALKVTPSEKYRIEWVAGLKGTDISSLLREMSVDAILAEHQRASQVVGAAVA